jgi:transposase
MATPYSKDLRDRVLAAYDRGERTKPIAKMFGVSPAWARRLKQTRRETGRTDPLPMGGATVVKIDMSRLAKLVQAQPDATLRELRERLGNVCSESAVCMALQRLGLSYKKRRSTRPSRTVRTSRSGVNSGRPSSPSATHAG